MPNLHSHTLRQNHVLIRNSTTRWRLHKNTLVLLHLKTSFFQQDSIIQSFRQFKTTPVCALSLSQKNIISLWPKALSTIIIVPPQNFTLFN